MSRRFMPTVVVACGLVCWAGVAAAQPAPATGTGTADAKELIVVMRMTDQFKQMLPSIMQALKPAIVQGRPQAEKDIDTLMPILVDGMSARVDDLANDIAAVYARNFTPDEIRDLVAFYRTPAGQKFIEKQPIVARESLAVGQAWGQKIAGELQSRMVEELAKRGTK